MRFHRTPRLDEALLAATPLATNADAAATLKQCAREESISLAEVQLISRLLIGEEACSSSASASGDASSTSGGPAAPAPAATRPLYINELLLGAAPVLPAMAAKPPAHPALAPRLDRLRAAQEDREYAKMVGGVLKDEGAAERDAAEMSTYRSQVGVGINLIVSMATMFTVGAYAGGTDEEPFGVRAVICGLALMLLTMAVEVSLFLIGAVRTDNMVHKRESRAKARGVADRTKLGQHVRSWNAAEGGTARPSDAKKAS